LTQPAAPHSTAADPVPPAEPEDQPQTRTQAQVQAQDQATVANGAHVRVGARARPESYSEATRLLCAGTYLDAAFRRRVIEELVEQRQRTIAPSLGIDAVPVLAHALRCRRHEVQITLGLALVWTAFYLLELLRPGYPQLPGSASLHFPVTAMIYAWACGSAWLSRIVNGRGESLHDVDTRPQERFGRWHRRFALLCKWWIWQLMAIYWILVFYMLTNHGLYTGLLFPALLTVPFWVHRTWADRVMRQELSPERFRHLPPLEPPPAYAELSSAIDREQYARLTVYDPGKPFAGHGEPHDPWSFAMELKRKQPAGETGPEQPLTSRRVIELVLPKLAALRQSTAATSRDRLRSLEIEHLVYLPTSPRRGDAGYDEAGIDRHVAEAVDEGAEARRYFLRIRVGAWDEQVVVSILVRVHTQGGMLVLEVAPHVLYPVRPEFHEVDQVAARSTASGLRNVVRAVIGSPAATSAAAISLVSTIASLFRAWLAAPETLPGEAPVTSVRELGSADEISLFQEMDVSRYVKTIQDRIASGVTDALEESGYETETFTQQIFNITEGAMYIGQMSGGAVAQGGGATATQRT
jgi:hypothetical protein